MTSCGDGTLKEVKLDLGWKEYTDAFVAGHISALMNYAGKVITTKCRLSVFVQGELADVCPLGGMKHELVFLTVHDVGTNPQNSFVKFVNSPAAAKLKQKSVFLHVCVPGQEPGAKDIVGSYPTMNQITEMLPQVLEHFGIVRCIAMGEGAGADIVCRFAFNFAELVNGLVLIHCTSTTHGIVEHLKETFANLRIEDGKMTDAAWNYLLAHKYGEIENKEKRQHVIEQICAQKLNENNLSRYLHSFSNREDFTQILAEKSEKVDTILITGGKSPHNRNIFHMFEHMDKSRTGLVVAENVVDVLNDSADFIVQNLITFCQRHVFTDTAQPPPAPEPDDQSMEMAEAQLKTGTSLAQPAVHSSENHLIQTTTNVIPHPKPVQKEGAEADAVWYNDCAAETMTPTAPVIENPVPQFSVADTSPPIVTTSNILPTHEMPDSNQPAAPPLHVPVEKPMLVTGVDSASAETQKHDFLTVCPPMCRHGSAQSDLSNVECPYCEFDS